VALGPFAVALCLSVAAYAPALRPGRQLGARDVLPLYYRLHLRVAEGHRALSFPARDPERGCGAALYADPLSQAAYPPSLVRALLPYDLGFVLWFVLHGAIAGAGVAHLARTLGATSRGACLAAAGTALSGPLLSQCRCPNLLAGAAWLGFALAAFLRLLDAPRNRAVVARQAPLAAGAIALMLLSGGIEVVLLLGLGVGALLAGRAPSIARSALGRLGLGAALVGGATGLGAALAAVHLLPAVLNLGETARGAIPFRDAAGWSLHPLRLVEALVVGLGSSSAWVQELARRHAYDPFGNPMNPSVHVGLPIALLAVAALVHPGRGSPAARWVRPLGLACGLWLLVALGPHAGLLRGEWSPFGLLRRLPLFDAWRYPGKAILPVAIVLPALAAVGLARIGPPLRSKVIAVTLCALVVAVRIDGELIFTLPRRWYHEPPAAARACLAEEARTGVHGRFMRLTGFSLPPRSPGEVVRGRHRDYLLEDLPGLFGLQDVAAYGPFINRRIPAWIQTCVVPQPDPALRGPGGLDLARLRDDAGVAHALLPPPREGAEPKLVHLVPPPRVRLVEGAGRVTVSEHGPTRIVAEVEVTAPALLHLTEAFDAGWSGTLEPLDGGPTTPAVLEESRVAFLGVRVPPGRWRLTLEYRVRGLLAGAALSALAAAALLALRRRIRLSSGVMRPTAMRPSESP